VEEGIIAFDIDGVLANFTRGFTRIGHQLFGTPVGDSESQQTWMFEEFTSLGLDKPKCDAIWKVVKTSPDFWATLDPKNVSVMSRINRIANKVFITNRPGLNPIMQSEHFLELWGIENPRVIVAAEKGEIAKREHVVAVIDDLNTNVIDIKKWVPDCYATLLYCNYNKVHHEEWLYHHCGEIVLSVDEFIDGCYTRGLIRETVEDDNVDARLREAIGFARAATTF
jgi:hypothetical protein